MGFLMFMAKHSLWDVISSVIAAIPSGIVLWYIFPRKSIKNFYIDTKRDSINSSYPKVVTIKLTNLTYEPIYVLSEGFVFGKIISASPNAAKDVATGVCEVKFEGRAPSELSEIDTLVRPNQTISTWIPVNPKHSDQEIDSALKLCQVGTLRLKCQRISNRRSPLIKLYPKI